MKIQILTDKNSWLNKNLDTVPKKFKKYFRNNLITTHNKLKKNNDITIIISYYRIIPKKFLLYSKHNLVIHESDLPKGRGMSPLYWQLLNGKKNIVFTLFECSEKMDSGNIYFKKTFYFHPGLIYEEIKTKQLKHALELANIFIKKYSKNRILKSFPQRGKATYYKKIEPSMSKLNIDRSIKSQIDKLRTRDNKKFPAYFYYKKRKYIIKLN
jgi:methionyl-tRNA formyltransferase